MKIFKIKYFKIGIAVLLMFAVAIGGFWLFRGKKEDESMLSEIITTKSQAYETDLKDSWNSFDSNSEVADFISNWGKNKSIKVKRDEYNNVVFLFKGNKEFKKERPITLICGFDYRNMELYQEQIITALTVSKAKKEHRKFTVIFTPEERGNKVGIYNLNPEYFKKNSEIYFLGDVDSGRVSITTGGFKDIILTKDIKYVKSKYEKAYRIYIKNIPVSISHKVGETVNPIKYLGSMLANFKSNNLLFELADFDGGKVSKLTPNKAEMTIIINTTDEEKFKEKLDNSISKFNDKYLEVYPDIIYAYEEVEKPKKVISGHNTEKLTSLLYTAPSGNYYKDDQGNVVALSNIGSAVIHGNSIEIHMSIHSYDQMYLDEILDTYEVIAGLTNYKLKTISKGDIGEFNDSDLVISDKFSKSFTDFTEGKEIKNLPSIAFQPKNYVRKINPDNPIISLNISTKTRENFIGGIIIYLSKLSEEV